MQETLDFCTTAFILHRRNTNGSQPSGLEIHRSICNLLRMFGKYILGGVFLTNGARGTKLSGPRSFYFTF